MHAEGNDIIGWQLNNPDQKAFDVQIVQVFGDCKDCEEAGECAVPCESVRRLVPKEGKIIGLGNENKTGKPKMSCFALLNHDEVKFIQLTTPDYLWATAKYLPHEQEPDWALSQLRKDKQYVSGRLIAAGPGECHR